MTTIYLCHFGNRRTARDYGAGRSWSVVLPWRKVWSECISLVTNKKYSEEVGEERKRHLHPVSKWVCPPELLIDGIMWWKKRIS